MLLGRPQSEAPMAALGAEHVVRLVDDDPKEPRPESSARLEPVERAVAFTSPFCVASSASAFQPVIAVATLNAIRSCGRTRLA